MLWHFLSDPVGATADGRSHPAGLYRPDPAGDPARDRAKPALRAFRFPLVAVRLDPRRARVWGLVPSAVPGRVTIERRTPAGWRTVRRLTARGGGRFEGIVPVRDRPVLRARAGGDASPGWRVDPG